MKQIRWITHEDEHIDEETLFGDIWAVTRCNCKLITKEKAMKTEPIYDGWTPTQAQPATKEQLIALRDLLLSHGAKSEAAAVDNVIDLLTLVVKRDIERQAADTIVKKYGSIPLTQTAERVEVRSNPGLQAGVRYVHGWRDYVAADGCGNDDLYDWSRGG